MGINLSLRERWDGIVPVKAHRRQLIRGLNSESSALTRSIARDLSRRERLIPRTSTLTLNLEPKKNGEPKLAPRFEIQLTF